MKIIKEFNSNSVKANKRNATRVFNILIKKLSYDELHDLCMFTGLDMNHYGKSRTLMTKGLMIVLNEWRGEML